MVGRPVRFVAVAAAVALAAGAQAQLSCNVVGAGNCAVNATASLTIPSLASITIPSNAISMDGSGITSFAALPYVPGAFGNVDVSANTTCSLTVGSAAAAWTGPGLRARNTLEWSIDGGTTWAAMAESSALPGVHTLLVDFTRTAP